jgi:hypothetical protein
MARAMPMTTMPRTAFPAPITGPTGDLVVADADHPIALRGSADEPRPYLHVRAGLEALIARSVFYELAELAIEEQAAPGAALGLWSGGHFFPMSPA